MTLYKWWPGGHATFNVTRSVDWERVKNIVDMDLAPFLGWKTTRDIRRTIKQKQADAKETDALLSELAASNPRVIAQIVKGLGTARVSDEDVGQLAESIAEIAQILVAADESHRLAIRELVRKLPSQGKAALQQLSDLMEELTLGQITAVTSEVKRRAGLLELFRERVLDERTYEITGDGSIHRLLEQAMWIVDERYWLMHSNKQLRTVVGNALAKEDKKFDKKRPDFVCGTVDKKLIVIEIKRPSHVLTVADLNQLERYVVLCDEYDDDHTSFEALLVGSKESDDLKRTKKMRHSSFRVRTYTQLIGDTERRYKDFLDALKK